MEAEKSKRVQWWHPLSLERILWLYNMTEGMVGEQRSMLAQVSIWIEMSWSCPVLMAPPVLVCLVHLTQLRAISEELLLKNCLDQT